MRVERSPLLSPLRFRAQNDDDPYEKEVYADLRISASKVWSSLGNDVAYARPSSAVVALQVRNPKKTRTNQSKNRNKGPKTRTSPKNSLERRSRRRRGGYRPG